MLKMFIHIRVLFVHQSSSPRQIGSATPRCPTGGDSSHGKAPSGGGGQDPLPDQRRGRAAASGGKAVRAARIQAPPCRISAADVQRLPAAQGSSGFRRQGGAPAVGDVGTWRALLPHPLCPVGATTFRMSVRSGVYHEHSEINTLLFI